VAGIVLFLALLRLAWAFVSSTSSFIAGSTAVKESLGSQKRLATLWFKVRARELGSADIEVIVEVEAKVVDLPVHAGELAKRICKSAYCSCQNGRMRTHSYTAHDALSPTFKLPTSISTFRQAAAALSSKSSQRPVRAGPLQRRIGGEVSRPLVFHFKIVWGSARVAIWTGERGVEFEKEDGGK
jgi:hypothetical protein